MTDASVREPGFRFRFAADQPEAVRACLDQHGFAIATGVITSAYARDLADELVRIVGAVAEGASAAHRDYIERAPRLWELYQNPAYLALYRCLLDSDALTINRTMGVIRAPAAQPMPWHSDHTFHEGPPRTRDDVLSQGDWPGGAWLYLSGCHPDHGGLAVIAGSHHPNWAPPEGFGFETARNILSRNGSGQGYTGMDVPGIVPLVAEPTDMIFTAARTFHTYFPNRGPNPRLAIVNVCRPTDFPFQRGWPLPDTARAFIEAAPDYLRPFLDGYCGITKRYRPSRQ